MTNTTNTENNNPNQPAKPRLKRVFRCKLELGPYPGTERKRYAFWHAQFPGDRIMTVVQLARHPKRLGDEKRNPVLYRNILDYGQFHCMMDVDKWVLISGGNALYHIVEPELRRISRPLASISGHHGNGSNKDAYWHPFQIEAGHGTEQLARWREQVLYVLEHKYCVYDQTEVVASLKSFYKEFYGDVLTEEISYRHD